MDIKTRWSSLVIAIQRFIKLIDPINNALGKLGREKFDTENINILKEIVMILEPVKLAVTELSKQSANLLTAEGTLIYVFQQLNKINAPLTEEFKNSLKIRIDQRRNKDLISLLLFLHNGTYPKSNEFFHYSSKTDIKKLASSLITRLFQNIGLDQLESDASISESENDDCGNEYIQLQKCITGISKPTSDKNGISIDKELKLLEVNKGNRTQRLEYLYKSLLTVKPTSTPSERVFSISGIFINKLRNRMNTDTLNALVFLKYYFLNKK